MTKQTGMTKTYNGYKNYNTWNVALWLANDESLYNAVKGCNSWKEAKQVLHDIHWTMTPDGVEIENPSVSHKEMDKFIKEIK
jgi:hypothetical protein